MQVINLEATISTPSLQVEMRTLRLGSGGGTTDYNDLSNKPKLEGVTLQGNVPISALGLRTSDLINDSGFITTGDIPTKTSDLTNDSNFQDATQVANAISAAIPTNVSSFTNDVGYITAAAIPTNVSAFTNDAGYLTSGDLPAFAVDSVNGQTGTVVLTGADIECGGSYHTNDAISTQIDAFTTDISSINANMPTKTSDLQNDSGYITATGAPVQTVNGATGDVVLDGSDIEYSAGVTVNSKIDAVEASIPTVPVASVNGQTGAVVLDGDDIEYSAGVTVNNKIDSVEAAIPTDTATIENVSIASFNDGDYNVPVNELIVNIDANVNGYTDVNIVATSKNLLSLIQNTVQADQISGITINSIDNNSINITSSAGDYRFYGRYIYLKAGTYCLSFKATSSDSFTPIITCYTLGGTVVVNSVTQSTPKYFTITESQIIVFRMFATLNNDATVRTVSFYDILLEIGTTATTFEPYGTCHTIALGQTVTTGGTLNVTTGELNITGGSTVSITPTEVKTLIGYNNIYADSGDVKKLTYYKISPLGVYNWTKTQI